MIDEVMFEIRELTGQEYRNVYAGQQPDIEEPWCRPRSPTSTTHDDHAGDRELVGVGSADAA